MSQGLLEPLATELMDDDLGLPLVIRHFERRLLELYEQGLLHGTTHTCMGQEYVPVALGPLLGAADFVFSNHRGHGHYLARFRDPHGLLAEIMGREGAVCSGVGGSQHIWRDRYLSTGIQGQSLPVATGTALHLSRAEPGALALTYIGDGTWGEGAVYEALNMACLWRLPLVVVTEHNGIAQSTPTERQLAGTIAGRAAAFGARYHHLATDDVGEIRARLAPLIAETRQGAGPLVIEFRTLRVGPHSKGDDTRSAGELAGLATADWYARNAIEEPERFARLDRAAAAFIDQVVTEVVARPPSSWGA